MITTTAVKDPVCGMDVEAASAAGRTEHKGQSYYFCGSKCKEKFDANPEHYFGQVCGKAAERPWLLQLDPTYWITALCPTNLAVSQEGQTVRPERSAPVLCGVPSLVLS